MVFIFAVADAARLTAMLSRRAKTTVAVMGRGNAGPPSSPAKLAAAIEFGAASNELQEITQPNAKGRLYRGYRLHPSIFRRWDNETYTEVREIGGPQVIADKPVRPSTRPSRKSESGPSRVDCCGARAEATPAFALVSTKYSKQARN
jgi:hypothetical protein